MLFEEFGYGRGHGNPLPGTGHLEPRVQVKDTSTFKRFVARVGTPPRPAAVCRRGRWPHLAVLDMPILLL